MSSGGGGSATTTSGIDAEFKPYLKDVLGDVTQRYKAEVEAGPGATVADLDPKQQRALELQARLAEQAMSGKGLYDTQAAQQRALENVMGSQVGQASYGGSLGSARQQKATQAAMADKALEFQQRRQQEAALGAQQLGEVGSTYQAQSQQRLDAPHTSAQRYFGYLGSAPQQTTQSGGGK